MAEREGGESVSEIVNKVRGIAGWMTDEEIKALYELARSVAEAPKPEKLGKAERLTVIVEIGSYRGLSTVTLALAVQEFGGLVWAIDPHVGDKYGFSMADADHLTANLAAFGVTDVVKQVIQQSQDAAREWKNGEIDVLWIDGDHEYDGVKGDIEAWTPFVRMGGHVALHDISDNWPGVRRAYAELLENPDFEQVYAVDSLRIVKRVNKAQPEPILPAVEAAKPAPKPKSKARK